MTSGDDRCNSCNRYLNNPGAGPGDCLRCVDPDWRYRRSVARRRRLTDILHDLRQEIEGLRSENAALNNRMWSIAKTIAFSPKDWSVDKRDAWIYGVALGWDHDAFIEICDKHRFTPAAIERLKSLQPDDGGEE